jgi:Radical SAM superfamily/4Fe-4S single cluster domain
MIDAKIQWPDDTPDDPRLYVPNVEFYITNICNIACTNCNRYNNYNFTGHQIWHDYESIYKEWSKKIRLQKITILGGEPLMNPSICDWIRGLNRIWDKRVNLLTNGTRLNKISGLYDALISYKNSGGNWVGVSVHNTNELDRYFEEIHKFLQGPITTWTGKHTLNALGGSATWGADYAFEDSNGLHVHVWVYDSFYNSNIYLNPLGNLTLHNSVPEEAHSECGMVKYKNYHFIRGKLHKCGPVGLMPEFDQQHTLDISAEDRVLLNNYHPLSIDEFDQRGTDFISNIDNVIPQCKFCPTKFTNQRLIAVSKKHGATTVF